MGRHAKTEALIEAAHEVLAAHHPMTVRQVFYALVSRQVVENTRSAYQAVGKALVAARKEDTIPWEWIEDRLRRPREVPMWSGLAGFATTAAGWYRRDVWDTQPAYVEVWLEKDALSGIFEEILDPYGVTLNVGRGYNGWDSIKNAADRLLDASDRLEEFDAVTVLYFGDFDPSGEDMVRSLRERLAFFDCSPELVKCALTAGDITRYNLPPDFTKQTDSRRAAFVAQHGDVAVELDALPIDVLRSRLEEEVSARMNLRACGRCSRSKDASAGGCAPSSRRPHRDLCERDQEDG
jgi:hypothetical protein